MQIVISTKAHEELADIKFYLIDNFGEKIADEKIDGIYKDIYMLSADPFIGRHVVDGLRRLVSGKSIIIYEVCDRFIEIQHIVDARTDYARVLCLEKE